MPVSISDIEKALAIATENESWTTHDIVVRAYAMGFSDARSKAIEIIKTEP